MSTSREKSRFSDSLWGDLFLYSLIFAGIMAVLMAVVVVQDFCEAMINRIGML